VTTQLVGMVAYPNVIVFSLYVSLFQMFYPCLAWSDISIQPLFEPVL